MFYSILRTFIMYMLVMVALRIMGKRQVGDMQPNELVITFLLSEIATVPIQDETQPIINGVIAVMLLVIVEIVFSVLALKSFHIRRLMSGRSIVIIKNGVIDQKAMRDVRMTVIDLVEQLRKQNVFEIEQVAFAVLETDGNLSVKLKGDYEALNKMSLDEYINGKAKKDGLELPVISDGKIIKESLWALKLTEKDLQKMLKQTAPRDVFLMTCDRYKKFTLVTKEQKV